VAFIGNRNAGTSRIRAEAEAQLDRELAISQIQGVIGWV